MSASAAQISANQINAQKSTGPVTEIGKTQVANNAIKHGLFSKNLILADEDPIEYQNLLEQLLSELSPHGTLEQTLTENVLPYRFGGRIGYYTPKPPILN